MKVKDICDLINGRAFKPSEWGTKGLPIIRIQNLNDISAGFNYYSGEYNKEHEVNDGELLFSWSGTPGTSFGAFSWYRGKGVLNQHIFRVLPKIDIDKEYLKYAINGNISTIISKAHGGVGLQHITKKELENIDIPVVSKSEQLQIVQILTKTENLISLRIIELRQLDTLIKSRFIEMFGNPLSNSQGLNSMPMTDVCDIIDGDRGRNYPSANDFYEDEYCLFLNAKNVTSNGFSFGSCMFITKEKDQCLRKGKLKRGDVVLTTRGTIGNLAYYTDEVPYENVRINSGMVILRMHKYTVNEVFFIEQFKMLLDDIKAKIANGSAQPQLPISTMNKIVMIIPDISKQNQFADFVAQVDKSKLAVQQSLAELETLKKSLMQQYFG